MQRFQELITGHAQHPFPLETLDSPVDKKQAAFRVLFLERHEGLQGLRLDLTVVLDLNRPEPIFTIADDVDLDPRTSPPVV